MCFVGVVPTYLNDGSCGMREFLGGGAPIYVRVCVCVYVDGSCGARELSGGGLRSVCVCVCVCV